MKRIVELDGVRTVAVAGVIACHYAPFSNWFNQVPAHYGGLGVDVFFVLSGFLITTILLELKHSEHPYKTFYARRFLRIMPPYLLLLVIVYGIAFFAHDPIESKKFVGQLLFMRGFNNFGGEMHALAAVLRHPSLIPNPLAITVNKFVDRDYPILPITGSLGPTWSLSVEEWFYVLWAPVVLLLNRRWIVIVGLLMCLEGMLVRWFIRPGAGVVSSADILIAGALLALWMEHRVKLPKAERTRYDRLFDIAAIVSMIVFVLLLVLQRERLSISFAEIAFAGGVCWLIRHAKATNPVCALLRWRPMVYIGSISYMLYLIHLPMYFLVRAAILRLFGNMAEEPRFWVVSIVSMALSVGFSALSWVIYEAPILRYKDHLTDWITGKRKEVAVQTSAASD